MDAVDKLLNDFSELFKKEKGKLPYHFNLLDAIGVCETAHSRILKQLLNYKSPDGKYEILERWLDDLKDRFPQPNSENRYAFKVENPKITVEKHHIDILVQDREYALIVENKSNWAGDQNAQLSRYIDTVLGHGYKQEQIFVLYLPPNDSKDPADHSWGQYKEDFKTRYAKLSWREDILPWMRERILPNVRYKDEYLVSALEQYIDHWDGRSGFRNIDSAMNARLTAFIKKALKWNKNHERTSANLANVSATIQTVEKIASESSATDTQQAAAKMITLMRIFGNEAKRDLEYIFWLELKDALKINGYEVNSNNLTPESVIANYSRRDWFDVGLVISFKSGKGENQFFFTIYTSKSGGYYGFPIYAKDREGSWKRAEVPYAQRDEQSKLIGRWASESMPSKFKTTWPWWFGVYRETSDINFRDMYLCDAAKILNTDNRLKLVQKYANLIDRCIRQFNANAEKLKLPVSDTSLNC